MPRDSFEASLDDLRANVIAMSDVVAARLQKAVTALETLDVGLARTVMEGDHEINELYLELEADCIELFALQQPVAGDLRLVAASFKLLTDLERIGDLTSNLGAYVVSMERELFPEVDLVDIGHHAIEMLDDAMRAYGSEDVELCHAVAERDDELDGLCERAADLLIRDLLNQDPTDDEMSTLLGEVNRLLLTIRDLERIGDHAVNIAARTLYMVENDDALLY